MLCAEGVSSFSRVLQVMAVGIHPVSMNVGLRLAVPDPTPYKRDVHVEFSEAVTVRSHL